MLKFLNNRCLLSRFAATIFGQLWRLEPLPPEKKAMWRREMDWLLCVSDHIVELVPTWQSFPDGTRLEVPRLAGNILYILAVGCSTPRAQICIDYHAFFPPSKRTDPIRAVQARFMRWKFKW